MAKLAALIIVLVLSGCATVPEPRVQYITQTCQEKTPDRPVMPTEGYVWVDIDDWAKRAIVEIERREAYEVKLRAALINCTR